MYNDYQLTDNLSAKAMRQKFDEIQGLEIQDLKEIHNKLLEQKYLLQEHNINDKFKHAINQIENSILSIEEILRKQTTKDIKSNYLNSQKEHNKAIYLKNIFSLNTPDEVYAKIRSDEEILNHLSSQNPPNTTPLPPTNSNQNTSFQPGINNPNSGNNSTTKQNIHKRNSPLQSSFIANLTKSFFIKKTQSNNHIEKYQNKFHNIISQYNDCTTEKKIVNNQIDLIRLILLYIALRPNCNYISKIAKIANSQFEVLLKLMP